MSAQPGTTSGGVDRSLRATEVPEEIVEPYLMPLPEDVERRPTTPARGSTKREANAVTEPRFNRTSGIGAVAARRSCAEIGVAGEAETTVGPDDLDRGKSSRSR
jgi:hypothetical protein